MKKQRMTLTASSVRIILILLLCLLFAGGVGVFILGKDQLSTLAEEVSNKKADADASSDNLANLQLLEQRLESYDDVADRLDDLRVSSEFPQFSAVKNIRAIADRYGISISTISFAASEGEGASQASATPAGTVQITFGVDGDIPYDTFLNFLNAIENNLPKLQLAGVSLPEGSGNRVSPGEFTLTLYTEA